jgi:uncharacterized protein (TIGR00159 family)
MSFIDFRFLDFLDIFLVAYLLYQVYMFIKGTVAINIFVGIFSIYLLWMLVKALNMQLLGNILGQVMGVGMVALIIVFQQELRRFFLMMGTRYFNNKKFSVESFFSPFIKKESERINISAIVTACRKMSGGKVGSLIVITRDSNLSTFAETGEVINSETKSRLIETIFFKNCPLHDGAMIINGEKIQAVACILPVSENPNLPKHLGLRHRAALGVSEITDAFVIIVSEETGFISYAQYGQVTQNITVPELSNLLENLFVSPKIPAKEVYNQTIKTATYSAGSEEFD